MESNPTELNLSRRQRIVGLDAIRFVLASWVVFGHYGFPALPSAEHANFLVLVARGLLYNSFNGAAAVIAFFVISGFCIHYGSGNSDALFLPAYFTRRWIRTLAPMVAAIGFSELLNVKMGLFTYSILWSLLCEEIYYLLYPLLLSIRSRFGWTQILVVSLCCAMAVAMSDPGALEYPSYGGWLNWILGLPCWILGCVLADQVRAGSFPRVSLGSLWRWRFLVWALSFVASFLRFHAGIGYPWTLSAFAFAVYPWLAREIAYAREHGAPRILEAAGLWSYSLYLMHLALGSIVSPSSTWPAQTLGAWALRCALAFVGSYAFSRIFELPMHQVARRAYRRVLALRMSDAWRETLTVSG